MTEHEKDTEKLLVDKSGVPLHSSKCPGRIQFGNAETVAVVTNKFDRKVREALEIQKHDCYYTNGGMNQDKGQYARVNILAKNSYLFPTLLLISSLFFTGKQ